ncbi:MULTISPECIES: hypothetical protein [Bacillus cereus group]|uniref:Uncharacterized protein n=1 Tax=Bacillus thuringiensis serovar mexicanensis TaxID=180868 RepID=A0A242WAW8_BACTU|nr:MULTISPECIES: hypothetical protein [Bacillus cereus group]EEM56062.1 hypothetical protein bthur0007_61710 [Bacillus thuringiensis serovar monterrey BGSC 4AJ1]MEB9673869.1 hypothetical protein [Bacillus anthracis]OTW50944.1 hypothetical protein BK699_10420 [Bacillus thuringiensis serovar mexicanensis]OTX09629.1 hypothetical protein BK705_05465 [Bacillus thuringiensis serovar monterrey]
MISWLNNIIKPTLEEQLFTLECKNEILISDIRKGRMRFSNNERVIEFSNLLTEKLVNTYKHKGYLNTYETEVLEKALKDGVYSMSYLLLSQLNDEQDFNLISKQLDSQGFQFIDTVGYINIKRIIPCIQFIQK